MHSSLITIIYVFFMSISFSASAERYRADNFFSSSASAKKQSRIYNFSPASHSFSKASLVGLQLSIKRAHQKGKVPNHVAKCIRELDESIYLPVYDSLLKKNLTVSEFFLASNFYVSVVGEKYTNHGLVQLYQSLGQTPPIQLPQFSNEELKKIELFSKSSVGKKLIYERILEKPAAVQKVNNRTNEIIDSCDK